MKSCSEIAPDNSSPQRLALTEQFPQQKRISVVILLDLDVPEPELSPKPGAAGLCSSNFFALLYQVELDALEIWVENIKFTSVSLG